MRTCGARKTENGKHYHCVGPADHLGDHAWAQDLMGDLEASLETAAPCDIRGCVGVAEHRWWTRDGLSKPAGGERPAATPEGKA